MAFYDGETIHASDLNIEFSKALQKALNLSDIADVPTALNNLGLGDIAKLNTPIPVQNGGTGGTTVAEALTNLGLTQPTPVTKGGTGATTASQALTNLGVLTAIANAIAAQNLGSASLIDTPIPVTDGGTGATSASAARTSLGVSAAITSAINALNLGTASTLATPIPIASGGTGATTASQALTNLGVPNNHVDNGVGATAASLSSNSATSITSIYLSAGTWEIWGTVSFHGGSTANVTYMNSGVNTSISTPAGSGGLSGSVTGSFDIANGYYAVQCGPAFVTVSGGATYYLVAQAGFSGSMTAGGYIAAKQIA